MPYLSHLLGSKVRDSADNTIGRLRDVLITPHSIGKYSPLEYLVIDAYNPKKFIYVPYDYVENFTTDEISLKNVFDKIEYTESLKEKLVPLNKNILDQQIVDMTGARVVRVNDLRIGDFDGEMCVLGIDISFKGLLRRLGFEWIDFFGLLSVHLLDWRQAQPVHKSVKIDVIAKSLNRLHPADLANIIEDLSVKHGSKLVSSMDSKSAAHVLQEIDPHLRKILVKYLGPDEAASILSQMSPDEVADLMQMLPKEEAKVFLESLQNSKLKKNVERLIVYPNDTAGGLMSLDYVAVRPEWTVKRARDEVKKLSPHLDSITYVYVTDSENHFKGVVSLRWLLIAPITKRMGELMKKLPAHSTLHTSQSIEDIIPVMTKYNLYTIAVLDNAKKMVGIVSIDDIMRHLIPDA